jgi:hypothetical protein
LLFSCTFAPPKFLGLWELKETHLNWLKCIFLTFWIKSSSRDHINISWILSCTNMNLSACLNQLSVLVDFFAQSTQMLFRLGTYAPMIVQVWNWFVSSIFSMRNCFEFYHSCWCIFDTNSIITSSHVHYHQTIYRRALFFKSINSFALVNSRNTLCEWPSITTSIHEDKSCGNFVASGVHLRHIV